MFRNNFPGLFLHAGYSKTEKSHITQQTGVLFENVAIKLNLLLQQQHSTEARV